MVTDFDAFARQFRERTAARLLEFEKNLAKAQDDLERTADKAKKQAQQDIVRQSRSSTYQVSEIAAGSVAQHGRVAPNQKSAVSQQKKKAAPPRLRQGQVQSVLRRD